MSKPLLEKSTIQQRASFPSLRWVITIAAVLLWLFGVVAAYFWAHKPFDVNIVMGLGRSLSSIAMWVGITCLGAALGQRIAGRSLADEQPVVRFALAAGLGLGLLSLITLGLGVCGLLRPIAAWGLVLGLGVLLRRDLRTVLSDARQGVMRGLSLLVRSANGFQRWLGVYVAASLLLTFLAALAPPTGWDALVYHLTGPRVFLQTGRLTHAIDLPYLGFPQLGEMQFTLGMLLAGDGVASLLHFGYGLLAVMVTAALARRAFGKQAAWLAAALLLSVPSLLSLMTQAYVEAILLFYVTAAVYAFIRWREARAQGETSNSLKWLRLMGLFCGFSAGVKYTAVAVPLALGLSLLWTSRRDGIRAIAGQLAQLAGITFVVTLPWLFKNWLTTGNPVYPFFLPGLYWDNWRAWWYDRPGTGLASTAPWRLVIAPLEATILGFEGGDPYDATIGPLLLLAVPLLVVVWRSLKREERSLVGYLLFFFGVNYGLWLVGLARSALLVQTRLLLPVFGVLAVLGSVALDRLVTLRRPQLAIDWLARTVLSLTLALLLFSTVATFLRTNPLPVALGLESRDDFLTRRLGVYQPVIQAVNTLPADAHVTFLWEPRTYGCQVDCWPDALLDRFLHLTYLYPDAASIAKAWKDMGVTHVLLYRRGMEAIVEAGFDPITPRDLAIMQDLQTHYLTPVREWGDIYILYELRP
jgi:4-amino-4-deoxy-L-arabinose transferase-like glycosyltransferase